MNNRTGTLQKNKEFSINAEEKNGSLKKKIFIIILKIIRWPLIMLAAPLIAFYISSNSETAYAGALAVFFIGTIATGVVGVMISRSFLKTTGIAALIFIYI